MSPRRTPDFLPNFLALANFMRLSLMKAAHTGVGGAPRRKSGYMGRKRWAQALRPLELELTCQSNWKTAIRGNNHGNKFD